MELLCNLPKVTILEHEIQVENNADDLDYVDSMHFPEH